PPLAQGSGSRPHTAVIRRGTGPGLPGLHRHQLRPRRLADRAGNRHRSNLASRPRGETESGTSASLEHKLFGMASDFREVDPRQLRPPPSRRSGADPIKLQRQIARFGASSAGMPPLIVYEASDGVLVIYNG